MLNAMDSLVEDVEKAFAKAEAKLKKDAKRIQAADAKELQRIDSGS
jgi:hypothetical protein